MQSEDLSGEGEVDTITGRDIELVVVGLLCLIGAGAWVGLTEFNLDPIPVLVLGFLGLLSLGIAWMDIRFRR